MCKETSNYASADDLLLLDKGTYSTPEMNLEAVRQLLQDQNRFVEALLLVRIESMFRRVDAFKPWHEWLELVSPELITTDIIDLPLFMRIIETRLEFVKDLVAQGAMNAAEIQLNQASKELDIAFAAARPVGSKISCSLATVFPRFALRLDIAKTSISDSTNSTPTIANVKSHINLADRARIIRDRRVERTCIIAAVQLSRQNKRQNDTSMVAKIRALHIQLVRQQIQFESRDTGEAIYLGHALNRLGILTVSESQAQGAEYLNLLRMFFERYVSFDIPDVTFSLASIGIDAAVLTGDLEVAQKYQRMKDDAARNCDSQHRMDHQLSVYLRDEDFFRNFDTEGKLDFWRKFQRNISVLIVVWAAQDVASKLLTFREGASMLTVGDAADMPMIGYKDSILKAAQRLKDRMFAFPIPVEDSIWDPWWTRVQIWLKRPDLTRSESIRQALLIKIQSTRTDQFGSYFNGLDAIELKRVLPRAVAEFRRYIDLLESVGDLRRAFEDCLDHVASLDIIAGAKLRLVNCYQILAQQPHAKAEGLVLDTTLQDMFVISRECHDYYKREGRLEFLVRISHLSAQCCWNRHLLFDSTPVTSTFSFFQDAERAYRQLRMENFVLKSSRAFVARDKLADNLQMNVHTALAVMCSLRALLQRLSGVAMNLPEEFTLASLAANFTWWVQRSKAQALTNMLGLDAQLPTSILPDELHQPRAFQLLQQENQKLMSLETASIAKRVTLLHEIECLRHEMRQEPSLSEIMNLREGFSLDDKDLRAISSKLDPNVVLVDWIFVPFLDEWDLAAVTYRNGVIYGIRNLSVKLGDVQKWIKEQLDFQTPLTQRFADRHLHKLDGLVAPLAELTKPDETLVFCPTKDLHRLPLHALKIGGQVAIERNPVVYCQSLSVLHLCQMSVQNTLDKETEAFGPCAFTPVTNMPGLEEGLSEIASILQTDITRCSESPKQSFVDIVTKSSLIHFHGHSEVSQESPLNQHLDFTGYALLEEEKQPEDMLTVNEIFDLRLKRPALVTIMGCSTGRAKISNCDNLLGLVTAFHYAGASSVISALWPIFSPDALLFSRVFYTHLMADMASSSASKTVNLARAMQAAVLALRRSSGTRSRLPYHWAGLVLHGTWLYPKMAVKAV